MSAAVSRVLVMGYGNPGRLDDGLGPAFAEEVRALKLPDIDVEADYQLMVEDAELISRYDLAIFADASVNGPAPFACQALVPVETTSFSTHHLEPGQVYYLAKQLFGGPNAAYIVGIRGYEYNAFGEGLSDQARDNLDEALAFFREHAARGWTDLSSTAGLSGGPAAGRDQSKEQRQ